MTAPVFDAANTGLRKRGEKTGAAMLTIVKGDAVEAFWAVRNADLVRLTRDDMPVGDNRATDGALPVPLDGLGPGDYTFKLLGGLVDGAEEAWPQDGAVELKLTVKPGLAVTSFRADPEPDDDDKDHPPQALLIAAGHKVKLHWQTTGAKTVSIMPSSGGVIEQEAGSDGKGELVVEPSGNPTVYKIVANHGDAHSKPGAPVTVHFHQAGEKISALALVHVPAAAKLEVYAFDEDPERPKPAHHQLSVGAGDVVQLKWQAAGAKSAHLIARPQRAPRKGNARPDAHGQVPHAALAQWGLDLPIDAHGAGSGVLTIHPGPDSSTIFSLAVTPRDGKALVKSPAEVVVANFSVQLLRFEGQPAAGLDWELSVPGVAKPYSGKTDKRGIVLLNLPDRHAERAELRLSTAAGPAQRPVASWTFDLLSERETAKSGRARRPQLQLGKRKTLRATLKDHPKLVEARLVHASYLANIPRDDEEEVRKAYIAQWCKGLSTDAKFADGLRPAAVEAFQEQYERKANFRAEERDRWAKHLIEDFLDDQELAGILDKLAYRGACERALLIAGLAESPPGREWLTRQAIAFLKPPDRPAEPARERAKEAGGFLGLIAKVDTSEGLEALDERLEDAGAIFETMEPFIDALAEHAGPIAVLYKKQAVINVAGALASRFGGQASDYLAKETRLLGGGGISNRPALKLEVEVIKVSEVSVVKGVAKGFGAIGKVASVLNFAIRLQVLMEKPEFKTYLESANALLQLLDLAETITKGANAAAKKLGQSLMRAGRTVGVDGLPKAAAAGAEGAAEAAGESLGRTLFKRVAEDASVIAVVVGIIDTITGAMDMEESAAAGDEWGFRGNATATAGSGMMVVGGAMLLTGVGAPLGAFLLVAGTIVNLVGSLITLFKGKSELELWAQHCVFGKDGGDDLAGQIEELRKAVYTAHVRGFIDSNKIQSDQFGERWDITAYIAIEPTLLTEMSAMKVELVGEGDEFRVSTGRDERRRDLIWEGEIRDGATEGVTVEIEYADVVMPARSGSALKEAQRQRDEAKDAGEHKRHDPSAILEPVLLDGKGALRKDLKIENPPRHLKKVNLKVARTSHINVDKIQVVVKLFPDGGDGEGVEVTGAIGLFVMMKDGGYRAAEWKRG